jgi:hypothetical protein
MEIYNVTNGHTHSTNSGNVTDVKIKKDAIFPLNQVVKGEANDASEEYAENQHGA